MTSNNITFRKADFTDPDLIKLLDAHLAFCTPPEHNVPGDKTYALDIRGLQKPNITLWAVYDTSGNYSSDNPPRQLLGCAALKVLPPSSSDQLTPSEDGELKSMHIAAAARGRGIGVFVVQHIIDEAKKLGLKRLYLETGSLEAFAPANRFYERCGFVECGPYGEYVPQRNSLFKRKDI